MAWQRVALPQIGSFRDNQMANARVDHVSWSFHRPEMHARQILADDADGEELRAGKYGNDRRQERKPGAGDRPQRGKTGSCPTSATHLWRSTDCGNPQTLSSTTYGMHGTH